MHLRLWRKSRRRAFTLVEVLVAMTIIGVAFAGLYSGLTYGFSRIRFSRENQRATQILVEKMETLRLYTWSQIVDDDFIPEKFEASYYPNADGQASGVVYKGTIEIDEVKLDANYEDRVRKVTVGLEWYTGKVKRTRSLSTYVTEFGMHKQIF